MALGQTCSLFRSERISYGRMRWQDPHTKTYWDEAISQFFVEFQFQGSRYVSAFPCREMPCIPRRYRAVPSICPFFILEVVLSEETSGSSLIHYAADLVFVELLISQVCRRHFKLSVFSRDLPLHVSDSQAFVANYRSSSQREGARG